MKKEEFLSLLRSKLDVLDKKEIDDIVEEYENHINQKMKDGMKEKEAIKDFGDIDELAKEILSAYKISDKYVNKKDGLEDFINKFVDKVVEFFQDLAHSLTEQQGKDILEKIVKICLILIFVALMRIPFYLFELLGGSIFSLLPYHLEKIIYIIWKIIIGFAYFAFSVFIVYYAVKKYIIDDKSTSKKSEKKETKTSKIKKEVVKEETETVITKEQETTISDVIILIIRVLVTFCTIPFLFCTITLYLLLGIAICFLIEGVYLISVLFMLLGLCLISSSILGLIYHITWKGSAK